jgi:hypothetical protein
MVLLSRHQHDITSRILEPLKKSGVFGAVIYGMMRMIESFDLEGNGEGIDG